MPGLGHWVLGRGGRGFIAFAAFTFGLNQILLSRLIETLRDENEACGFLVAGAAVLFSMVDVLRTGVLRRRAAVRDERKRLLDAGVDRVRAGDLRGGRSAFERALDLDEDDATARLHVAWAERLTGRHVECLGHARAGLRVARDPDVRAALSAEVEHAHEALHRR